MEQKRTIAYIDPDLHRQLKALAANQGVTIQELVEKAICKVYKLKNGAAR